MHTIGPWTVTERNPDADTIRFHIGNARVQNTVGFAYHGDDARLIAAAPDLLAALKALVRTFKSQMHLDVNDKDASGYSYVALEAAKYQLSKLEDGGME